MGRTIVVDGVSYHVSVRSNREALVFTSYPEGNKRSFFRLWVPWSGTSWAVLESLYRPALAERLVRRARRRGWRTVLTVEDGRALIEEIMTDDPLPPPR